MCVNWGRDGGDGGDKAQRGSVVDRSGGSVDMFSSEHDRVNTGRGGGGGPVVGGSGDTGDVFSTRVDITSLTSRMVDGLRLRWDSGGS